MKDTLSRKPKRKDTWPRQVQPGRAIVTVYRRLTPQGNFAFMVSNYVDPDPDNPDSKPKRRFDCYANEADALDAADKLARRLDARDYVAASMTRKQALEYAGAVQALAPFNVSIAACASTVAECLKAVGDLAGLHAASRFYAARHKAVTRKPVAEVVAELLSVKEKRGASARYLQDLRFRLGRFADAFHKDTSNVATADIQAWLDGMKAAPQTLKNFRTVVNVLFEFAVARGYAADNPVAGTENVKVNGGDVEVFSVAEITKLLSAASADFVPALAICAFAGLRTAEVERLDWSDIDLAGRNIIIGASKSKTASRRIVPIADNLAAWLAPYAGRHGKVWRGGPESIYKEQQVTAEAAGLKWKANALRHSCASYMFAACADAGRVAGYLGNSAAVIHKHYRELVKPADAVKWFAVMPPTPVNVLPLQAAAAAAVITI